MSIFDSGDDGKSDGPRKPHWLDGWLVELPVNTQGKLEGKSIANHNPADDYKPWYSERAKTINFRVPAGAAATSSPGRAPRCELKQTATWKRSTLKFNCRLERIGGTQTIAQAREKGGSVEMFQLRAFADGKLEIRTNKSLDPMPIGTWEPGKAFDFKVSIKDIGSIVCDLNGKEVAKVKIQNWPGGQIWKFGLYGRDGGEAVFRQVQWS